MGVERSSQSIILNHEQILSLARKAFPDCQKLDKWELLSGGAVNTIYKVQIGPDVFVLKIYLRARSHCKTEKTIHQLIDKNVSTPKLIYADEEHQPWAYSISEFVSGAQISEVSAQEKAPLSYELGRVLALIHAFKLPQAGLFGDGMAIEHPFEVGSNPYFEETYSVLCNGKNIRSRLGEKLTDAALIFIEENKDFFPKVRKDNIVLTHSDFKPVNLLYTVQGKISVLDWEFAHAGMGLLDFAILLRHRHEFPLDLDTLENGYLHFGGQLPNEWLRSSFITDFVNMVTLMDTLPERPQLFHQLKNAISSTIAHWESPVNLYQFGRTALEDI